MKHDYFIFFSEAYIELYVVFSKSAFRTRRCLEQKAGTEGCNLVFPEMYMSQ